MTMSPRFRKSVLAVHLMFSVGWIGAVVTYLVLGVVAVRTQDAQTVRGAWIAMELTGWYALVPLAVGTLLTGLVMSLGTKWGLFRYYWVLIALALTIFATVVLLLHMPAVSAEADMARRASARELDSLGGDLFHPTVGLVVLLLVLVLNIYKPPGMTRYGWRRQSGQRTPRKSIMPRSDAGG